MQGLLDYNHVKGKKKWTLQTLLLRGGSGRVNWLLFSVVLQCLQPPNQCETDELCDPMYSIVLFIDFTSQHCWKTVLISSINVSFIIHIKPITFFLFYYVVIRIHPDILHLFLFLFKAFILLYEEKPNLSTGDTVQLFLTLSNICYIPWFCMHWYGKTIMYYIFFMVSKQWWLMLNVIFLQCKWNNN